MWRRQNVREKCHAFIALGLTQLMTRALILRPCGTPTSRENRGDHPLYCPRTAGGVVSFSRVAGLAFGRPIQIAPPVLASFLSPSY